MTAPTARLRRFWANNALSIIVLALFLIFWCAQGVTGWSSYNEDQRAHQQATVDFLRYLGTSHFWSTTAENWESEFLQMGLYVALTVYLKQRGSAESNPYPDEPKGEQDPDASEQVGPDAPWPVRRGGGAAALHRNSLTIALLLLFAGSFLLHFFNSHRAFNQEQLEHGQPIVSTLAYLGEPEFWFQSFQNWQSEFLAIAAMVVLSIYLRQVGSSQSKAVSAPNAQTGD